MEAPVAVSYGPVPGEVYAGHRFIDVLIHGWDLAVATGQDSRLDPELVETCWEIVRPQLDLLQGSGAFGTEVDVPDDADSQRACSRYSAAAAPVTSTARGALTSTVSVGHGYRDARSAGCVSAEAKLRRRA